MIHIPWLSGYISFFQLLSALHTLAGRRPPLWQVVIFLLVLYTILFQVYSFSWMDIQELCLHMYIHFEVLNVIFYSNHVKLNLKCSFLDERDHKHCLNKSLVNETWHFSVKNMPDIGTRELTGFYSISSTSGEGPHIQFKLI